MNNLHENSNVRNIRRADIQRAGEVLASAFRGYPYFKYCIGDDDVYQRVAPGMFGGFARWALLYGNAWGTHNLNAVALRLPPGTKSFGFWSSIRSGLLFKFMKMDNAARRKFGRTGAIIGECHQRVMGSDPHWHCWMMGVEPNLQGQGVGRQLMQYTFEQTDRARLPCYLETFSENSVRVHESQSYTIREALKIPDTPLTLYAMVRPPQ